MRLFFLGTGGSWPTKRRGPMSIGLRSNTATLLLDCGEGTQRQLLSSPLSPMKIDGIFITHLHGDHFLGLPGLVQSMCLNDRKMELLIFGPEGTIDSWDHAVHMCPFTQRFPIIVKELTEGDILDIKDLKVTCVQADHSIPTLSYRFDEKERPGRFNREKAVEMGIPEGPLWGRIQRGEIIVQKKDGKEISVGPRD
ncbi:MAG: MBL fold metallo-hydrolase, partial [Candidatus Thermoplasmatota archaeon]|nr:MBL fold metallo-hydrolase [Candidatus Thermoplasmatota archaeon]